MNVQKAQLQKADYCPPPPDGDFYRITDILDESERTPSAAILGTSSKGN